MDAGKGSLATLVLPCLCFNTRGAHTCERLKHARKEVLITRVNSELSPSVSLGLASMQTQSFVILF